MALLNRPTRKYEDDENGSYVPTSSTTPCTHRIAFPLHHSRAAAKVEGELTFDSKARKKRKVTTTRKVSFHNLADNRCKALE